MTYSIKKEKSALWKLGYTKSRVVELYAAGKTDNTWLICPSGEAESAITMKEFIYDQKFFEREVLKQATAQKKQSEELSIKQPSAMEKLALKTIYGAGTAKVFYYVLTYFQLKPAVKNFSDGKNLFQMQKNTPSVGFATFREGLNDFSTIFLYFGLAAFLTSLVLDRLEQSKKTAR